MKKEEFCALPTAIAMGLLWDASAKIRVTIGAMEAPHIPQPPRFDSMQFRKGGYNFVSEMTLESLEFWKKKAEESANAGGQYAEKDAKRAKNLEYWIAWRRVFPEAIWSGERNHEIVTAKPPSKSPELHTRLEGGDWVTAPKKEEPNGSDIDDAGF